MTSREPRHILSSRTQQVPVHLRPRRGFALLGLLLGAVGLYSVISRSIAQRTRELDIRMALGARVAMIVRLLLKDSGRIAIAGIVIGTLRTVRATRLREGLLFGVERLDLRTFAAAGLGMVAVAIGASVFPARTAVRVDPREAIRAG